MIHVVTGPPCAGKSTYVSEHAKEGDVIVDYDIIAQALGEKKPHCATGAIKEAAFKARRGAIDYLVEHHEDAEGWIIHSEPSKHWMDVYGWMGAEITELDTDEETCLARAEEDDRPEEVIQHIHEWFEKHGKKSGGIKMIKRKTVEIKAADNGSISGYASTWIREADSWGDVVAKGAFAECIEALKKKGKNIPLLYDHNETDLKNFIGTVMNLEEDDHGLRFDADFDDTEEAQRARQLAADGRLCKFSFAYDVLDQGTVTLEDGTEANELRKLNIHEVSLVMYPANPDTSVISVKSGRRNSAKDEEKLRQIIQLAQECLGELEDNGQDDDAKSKDPDTDNDKELKDALLKEADEILSKAKE